MAAAQHVASRSAPRLVMAKQPSKVDGMRAMREADARAAAQRAKEKAEAPLTEAERMKLVDLEMNIREGLETFVTVGASLAQIREQRLYRETHDTFEAYCQERWDWTASRARQLIGATEVVQQIESVTPGNTPPTEKHARELVSVPTEKRAEVWQEAVEGSGGKPTAKDVAKAAKPYKPASERKPRKKVERSEAESEPVEEGREDSESAEAVATPALTPDASAGSLDHDERLAYLLNAESALAHAASFRGLGMAAVQTALDTVREVISMLRQEAA